MSAANVDLVRSLYADWERGDYSSVEWAHPKIEFVIADGPSPGTWTGVAAMREGFRGVLNAWDEYRSEASGFRIVDEETVLTTITISGRGKTSGVRLQARAATMARIRGGKITKLVIYWDRERAFADLGLSPEGESP